MTSVLVTRMALPFGGGAVATRLTIPPTPSIVIFVLIVSEVVGIGAGLHLDNVAVTGRSDGRGQGGILHPPAPLLNSTPVFPPRTIGIPALSTRSARPSFRPANDLSPTLCRRVELPTTFTHTLLSVLSHESWVAAEQPRGQHESQLASE